MAGSKIDICNHALSFLGDFTIMSLGENNKPARMCNLWYDKCRRLVLAEHDWSFASKMQALALKSTTPLFGFSLAYGLPSDFIRATQLEEKDTQYKIVGRELHTDDASAKLLYVYDLEDPALFSPLMEDAIALMMCVKIGFTITGAAGITGLMQQQYERALAKARGSDSQQDAFDEVLPNEWIEARQ